MEKNDLHFKATDKNIACLKVIELNGDNVPAIHQ